MIYELRIPKVCFPRAGGLQPRTLEERNFGAGMNYELWNNGIIPACRQAGHSG